MLKDEKIEIGIINHNLNHYRNIGFDVKYGDKIIVSPFQLSSGSHYRVDCVCDNCMKVKNMKFQDYYGITKGLKEPYYCQKCVKVFKTYDTNLIKYGSKNVSGSKIIKERKKETNLKNWGVENVFQNEQIKEKCKETLEEKYGVSFYTRTQEYRDKSEKTRIIKNSKIFSEEEIDFKKYKKLVRSYTRISRNELFKKWNGLDYYDDENLSGNFIFDPSRSNDYPTIDHKISIFEGFKNNINPEKIGHIDNLCITKRINNSSKRGHLKKPKRLNENKI